MARETVEHNDIFWKVARDIRRGFLKDHALSCISTATLRTAITWTLFYILDHQMADIRRHHILSSYLKRSSQDSPIFTAKTDHVVLTFLDDDEGEIGVSCFIPLDESYIILLGEEGVTTRIDPKNALPPQDFTLLMKALTEEEL